MISGSGWGTAPGQILWFCHICQWSGVLLLGEHHRCGKVRP